MQKIVISMLCLISSLSWGKTPESELQKLNPDVSEDYIVIYQDFKGPDPLAKTLNYDRSSAFLKTTLTIYDNIDLKGDPVFIVTPNEIQVGSVKHKYTESFVGICKPKCERYNFIPVDFVRVYMRNVALAVVDYTSGIARVVHKNKSYYFKFKLEDTRSYVWRTYKKRENIKKKLEEDSSYLAFSAEVKKCLKKKDLKCLDSFLDDTKLNSDKILLNAKKRAVYDNETLCKRFEVKRLSDSTVGVDDVPEDLTQEVKSVDYIWNKLENVLNLNSNNNYYSLEVGNFGAAEHVRIFKGLNEGQKSCGQKFDLNLELFKDKNNLWKIISFDLYSFTY